MNLKFVNREKATWADMLAKAKGQAFPLRKYQLFLVFLTVVSKVVELLRASLLCVLVGLLAAHDVRDGQVLGPLGNGNPVRRCGVFFHLSVHNRQHRLIEAFCSLDNAI